MVIVKMEMTAVGIASMLALATTAAHAALDDAKAQDIMKKGGCTACHSVDKKVIGPAYKDVALKYKGESDALAKIEKAVRSGSKGTYGSMPMPPNPQSKISDEELHDLVEWVLTK